MAPQAYTWRRIDAQAAITLYAHGWSLFTIGAVLCRSWMDVAELLSRPSVVAKVKELRE